MNTYSTRAEENEGNSWTIARRAAPASRHDRPRGLNRHASGYDISRHSVRNDVGAECHEHTPARIFGVAAKHPRKGTIRPETNLVNAARGDRMPPAAACYTTGRQQHDISCAAAHVPRLARGPQPTRTVGSPDIGQLKETPYTS